MSDWWSQTRALGRRYSTYRAYIQRRHLRPEYVPMGIYADWQQRKLIETWWWVKFHGAPKYRDYVTAALRELRQQWKRLA